MTKIEVILLIPAKDDGRQTKKMKCKGVVVRSEPILLKDTDKAHYHVAIFFTEISKKDQKVLESYISSGCANENEKEVPITG